MTVREESRRRAGSRIGICLFLALLLWLFSAKVRAIETGSITLKLPENASSLQVTVYPVASNESGSYVCTGAFAGSGITVPDLNHAENAKNAAEQFAAYAENAQVTGVAATPDASGICRFTGLQPGLYLVMQTAGRDVLELQRLLVPIPYLADDSGNVSYDAVLEPKYEVPDGAVILNKTDESGKVIVGVTFMLQKKTYVGEDGVLPENVLSGTDVGGRFYWETVQQKLTTDANGQIALDGLSFGMYQFVEIQTPAGYVLDPAPHFFEIKSAGTLVKANGTYQAGSEAVPVVSVVNRKEQTGSITVKKTLTDLDGRYIAVPDLTFYAALFSDEARTERISDVKPIHFTSVSTSSVTFENLKLGTTYYVGETDANGILQTGQVVGDGVYTAEYPGGYSIRPTKKAPDGTVAFRNVYTELPYGFYYEGELTVTKKVLRGTGAYKTDETFYAAVFTNAAHTERYGDVIALQMNGESEVSQTVPVYIGTTPEATMTYYVAETDKDGNPISNGSGLAFEVSIDKAAVKFDGAQMENTVVITNTYPPETPDTPATPGRGGGGSGIRTGDETPVVRYVVLLVVAAVVIIGGVLLGRRKRNK